MALTLTADEKTVKSWNYAKQKQKKASNVSENITVTTKRLIHSKSEEHFIVRNEIGLKDIKGISSGYHVKPSNRIIFVFLTVLMLIACVVLWISTFNHESTISPSLGLLLPAIISTLLTFVFLILAIKAHKESAFYLNVYVNNYAEMAIAGEATYKKGRKKRKSNNQILKIEVDENIAHEIVDMIGALTIANN